MELRELRKDRDKIINEFQNGMIFEELIKKYNATWSQIYDIVAPSFRHKIEDILDNEKEIIIKLYNEGISTTKIGVKLKIHHKVVAIILKENGIKIQNNGIRKYYLNEHYFDNIDTSNKAYILGFFYADGYNGENKSTITMSLEEHDKEILEKIRTEIGSERPLELYNQSKRKDKDNNYHYNDMYKLLMFSTHMCNTLHQHGMVQNKSLILDFPTWLDPALYKDFIRGYFDGDGSFCPYYTKQGKFQSLITFTSTENFCIRIQEILKKELDIPGGNVYDASCHNGITKVLSLSGTIQTKKILDWLYSNDSLHMERKYQKYINTFYTKINNSQTA